MKKIISYNVNGIRAAAKKGFYDWLQQESPDIICLQESKAQPDQLTEEMLNPEGYHGYWHSAEKKGYSGTVILSKEKPAHVEVGMGNENYDKEGRVLRADYDGYSVISLYLPSGSSGDHRQAIKEDFLKDFKPYIKTLLREIPNLIIAGDYNIAHTEIDIHDPVRNKNSSGFLLHEREWMTEFIDEIGMVDSFRKFNPEGDHYSWWSYRTRARESNKGWRIDYHMLSPGIAEKCTEAGILSDVVHSDHCPIYIKMDI
ncbi:MAG: exodeoxyribonuclease III [Bacteroidia bacterium]|nr:exodeoxyribonuclease III [Bacteroidia bacterium]